MITMQDTNSRYRAGRKSPSSGDSALTPLPRAESFSLDDLPLPVPGGCGSRATGVRCYDVRGERVKGKQVGREQGEDLPLPVPGGCGRKVTGRICKKVRRGKGKKVRREKVEKKIVPCLKVMHWNAEGVMNKADALKYFCMRIV